ncbi:THxN family PEP-CTERM protein [Roseibacterium sp. SDUM158017]|uniref:THxN family PEP-CTERM protein n=1 Tax=Roseicyclus salinarum TaxID=3036773 RepID=UPI0024157092|nr:THxN family PEP-CTERM protein [Roseibacterium sp. SDUM158017]MDG4649432.1 THxN family PEP-CTERM protein [Roseibacterium sp. SDUM158017]
MAIRSRNIAAAAAVAAGMFCAGAASAITVNGLTVDGVWLNPALEGGSVAAGAGTDTITWGEFDTSAGYAFEGGDTATAPGTFRVGTFYHDNTPIRGDALSSTDLSISISGEIGGVSFSFAPRFSLTHDETINSLCTPGCPDVITVTAASGLTETIRVGDTRYTIAVDDFDILNGFVLEDGSFLSAEGTRNGIDILGSITMTPVPLPAAGWMLLAGLGGLAMMRRRQSRAD